jgi:hypothetical protein
VRYVNTETGREVNEEDLLLDFRGEKWRFISITRQGTRVYVKRDDGGSFPREFYPGVFPGHEIRE